MAQSATISGLFGGYTHSLVVSELSQDAKANTTRVRIVYGVRRETRQEWGAWTGLNNVTFNAVVNGVTHSENPNFDFRDYSYKTMIDTEQVITHGADGTKTINIAFNSNALAGSIQFVASSKSGTFTLDPLNNTRATQLQTTRPNPISEGGALTITFNPADPAYTHRLRWSVDDAAPTTITASATSPYVWTIPNILGGSALKVIELYLDTYSGATLLGTDTHEIVVRLTPEYPQVGEGTPYDLRFRRMVLDGGNWEPREPIPYITASFTDTFSATAVCSITVSEHVYDTDLDNAVVGVEVFDGAQWISPDLRFALQRIERDPTDEALSVTYTGTSYVDYIFSKGLIDREREFKSTTPGDILLGELQRAQRRGWGPLIGIDHTATKTSVGTNWKNSDVTMTLAPDTPFLQILDGMVKDVLVEYRTAYKNNKGYLRLMNPGTGSDWTVTGADPVINLSTTALYRVADSAPIRKDYSSLLTRVRIRGDEVSRTRERASLVNPLYGHLEGSVQATDVKNTTRLDRLGDATLTNQSTATIERTFTYDLSSNETPPALYPYRTYRPGDWILAPNDNGTAPVRSRVAQIAITRDASSTKATVTVGDMIPSGVAATARKLTQQSSGAIAGGSLRAPAPLTSGIPAAPTGLVGTPAAYWDPTGAPKTSVDLVWNPVTTSVENTTLAVDLYEVWTRPELGQPWVLAGVSATPEYLLNPLEVEQTLDIRVKARSTQGIYGVESDMITVTTGAPVASIEALTVDAIYTNGLGTIFADWDGSLGSGALLPAFFSYMNAEISPDDGADAPTGVWSVKGNSLAGAGTVTIQPDTYGKWWVRFRAYDKRGNPGANGTPVRITTTDPSVAAAPVPAAPTGLTATAGAAWDDLGATTGDYITVAWNRPGVTYTNLVPDPETTGLGQWLTAGGTESIVSGKYRSTANGSAANYIYAVPVAADATSGRFTVTIGEDLGFRAEVTNPNAFSMWVRLGLAFYNSSGVGIAGTILDPLQEIGPGETQVLDISAVVPSNAGATTGTLPLLYIYSTDAGGTPTAGTVMDTTHWALYRGSVPDPINYFSGATPDDEYGSHAWAGTTNASRSTRLVPVDVDGNEIGVAYYEVEGSKDGGEWANVLRLSTGSSYDIPVNRGDSWAYRVRAVGVEGGVSAWSNETAPEVADAGLGALAAPSAPEVTSAKASLYVEWNGLTSTGAAYPNNSGFRYAYVQVAPDVAGSPGTWERAGAAFPGRAGTSIINGLALGTSYHARIVAVDGAGTTSTGVAVGPTPLVGVSSSDITPGEILGTSLDPDFANGATITGATIQTDEEADKGVKIASGGLVAYDEAGDPTFLLDAATGSVWFGEGTISGNAIDVSTIDVATLQAELITNGIGDDLMIGARGLVSIISGLEADVAEQGDNLSTFFDFGATGNWKSGADATVAGLRISSTSDSSAFNSFAFQNGFQIRRGNTALSWWEADASGVVRFVTPNATIVNDLNVGSHKMRPGAAGITIISAQ